MTTIPPKISTTQETGGVVGKKGYDPHMTGEGRGAAGVGSGGTPVSWPSKMNARCQIR